MDILLYVLHRQETMGSTGEVNVLDGAETLRQITFAVLVVKE